MWETEGMSVPRFPEGAVGGVGVWAETVYGRTEERENLGHAKCLESK